MAQAAPTQTPPAGEFSGPIDWDKTGGDFKVIPIGKHAAHVFGVKAEFAGASAKNAGAPQANIQYKVDGGLGSVWDRIPIVPSQLWKIRNHFVACGMEDVLKAEVQTYDDFDRVLPLMQETVGSAVVVEVGIDPPRTGDDGRTFKERNSVKRVLAPGGNLVAGGPVSGAQGW